MRLLTLLLTLSVTCLSSCSHEGEVKATILGLGNDIIYIENYKISNIENDPIMDTLYSKNGEFSFNLSIDEPIISIITPKKSKFRRLNKELYIANQKSIILILKPKDKVSIKGRLHNFNLDYNVKGSLINGSLSKFRKKYNPLEIRKTKIELQIDTLTFNKYNNEELNNLYLKRKSISDSISKIQLDYIKNNWGKNISAYYLFRQPLDTLGKYYSKLHENVKTGVLKELLENGYLRFQKFNEVKRNETQIQTGRKAPNFSLKSNIEKIFSTNFSEKEYTVIDFWGSWCLPCIAGFPKMKKYYKKYNKRIEFIGVACNDSEEKWKNAIKKYDLEWANLINNSSLNKDVSVMYAVRGFPTKVIINSRGIIEGVFQGEGDDFYAALDTLIKKK